MDPLLYPPVFVKPKIETIVFSGHPWIFSGGIESEPSTSPGSICEIHSGSRFLGIGYWNPASDIRVRILTNQKIPIAEEFFQNRLLSCFHQRKAQIQNTDAFRLINAESDFLPGLILDIYKDCGVIQIHTLGMEKLKDVLISALQSLEVLNLQCIYEKSDSEARKKEGLNLKHEGILAGCLPNELCITENGFRFLVDIPNGQKTGFFLDQRENRKAILPYVGGKKVLNCFAYTGGFSVYAASKARKVISLDISRQAIELAIRNFELNGYLPKDHEFITENAFDYLKQLQPGQVDVIILDPPSMAKGKSSVPQAVKAYITLNTLALKALPDYGILISSSCTTHIDEPTFIKILHQSATIAGCKLQVLESKLQPADHPYLLSFPEGRYLKFMILLKIPSQ